jgi:CDP-diacylglycerol--serine O-phosphatidyltransferase
VLVGRRRDTGLVGGAGGNTAERPWRRIVLRRSGRSNATVIAPVSPALPPMLRDTPGGDAGGPISIPLLPGARTPVRRFKFAVANGCTVASLLLGMSAVFFGLAGEFRFAAVALLACVVLDGFDGGLARRFGVASPFGAQMDSLADLSSFGVATAIVVYQWLVFEGAHPAAAGASCALIAVCAAIRLARFNVSPKDGRYFCGVPTTMTAAVLAINILVGPDLPVYVQVGAVAVYALAMVTSFPYAKLVRVLHLPPWMWIVPAVGAYISVPVTFAAIVTAYVISGPVVWFARPAATSA